MGSSTTWIDIETSCGNAFLVDHGALHRLKQELPSLAVEHTGLVLFWGDEKGLLTRSLYQDKFPPRRGYQRSSPGMRIYHKAQAAGKSQLLLAAYPDSERIPNWSGDLSSDNTCKRYPLSWSGPINTIVQQAFRKLLAPFSDVICFVAQDLTDITRIAREITDWAHAITDSTKTSWIAESAGPTALIACKGDLSGLCASSHFTEVLGQYCIAGPSPQECIRKIFGHIEFAQIGTTSLEFQSFKELLDRAVVDVHRARSDLHMLFSFDNFVRIFEKACQHFTQRIEQPFDAIQASRVFNSQASTNGFLQHIPSFLTYAKTKDSLANFAIPVIASALVNDSYIYGRHTFMPGATFRSLYEECCIEAFHLIASSANIRLGILIDLMKTEYHRFSSEVEGSSFNPQTFHSQLLASFSSEWKNIYSTVTCFFCLKKRPEYSLPCNHALCEGCIRHLASQNIPTIYTMHSCMLCAETFNCSYQLKPPTAGVRILTLDGGGIRGIIELEILALLQRRLNISLPIRETFDLIVGTSAGGLIALGLCANKWSVEQCTEVFEELSTRAFQPHKFGNIPILGKASNYLMSLFTDSFYDTAEFEKALHRAYGSRQPFGLCGTARVAVTTTSSASYPYLMTNYNGIGLRRTECGYAITRPENASTETTVYEASNESNSARCTSAAPWLVFSRERRYHKPKALHSVFFQDGGVKHNNPAKLALRESRVLWPLSSEPDLLISVGAGYRVSDDREGAAGGFISRLIRSWMQSMDGQLIWQELHNQLKPDQSHRYHRPSIPFIGTEPTLDDVGKMADLKLETRAFMESSSTLDQIALSLLSSLFYF
ncbi:FabD/lysophospholipase-like protein [Choiromyces venosus 120613-1]|uniref:FabD/lysophospholipase-like protein n=1 Tax=Choiromyces venosus 120613-1 TaxID=1336337 RepID=A0A3N4IYM5_9PEZI|nr:FabD/lysophospholipase-like protein [Choiromyces venosus 120613-1]